MLTPKVARDYIVKVGQMCFTLLEDKTGQIPWKSDEKGNGAAHLATKDLLSIEVDVVGEPHLRDHPSSHTLCSTSLLQGFAHEWFHVFLTCKV